VCRMCRKADLAYAAKISRWMSHDGVPGQQRNVSTNLHIVGQALPEVSEPIQNTHSSIQYDEGVPEHKSLDRG